MMLSPDNFPHKTILELSCVAQNYDWGIKGQTSQVAKIHQLNGETIKDNMPYAELWMGTHPNGPTTVKNAGGQELRKVLGKDLPFLFKILSVGKALSIQAHPDKKLAEHLHKEFPNIYKDANHKPEIAIALTAFEALCGFRPLKEIIGFCENYPEFYSLISSESLVGLENAGSGSKSALKLFFTDLMNCDQELVKTKTKHLLERLQQKDSLTSEEKLFIRLNQEYPDEVGCFCIFVMNYVTMQPGECIFMAANEPHAYLLGECVECMALSDNVVRAGLTPKFRDVETLCNMLTFNSYSGVDVFTKPSTLSKHSQLYEAPVDEFSVVKTAFKSLGEQETIHRQSETILLCLEGEVELMIEDEAKVYAKGSILLLPADLNIGIKCASDDGALLFQAFAPAL